MKTGIIIILLFSIFLIVGIIGYLYISKVNKEPQLDNSKNIDIPYKEPQSDNSKNIDIPYKEPQKKDAECSIPNGTTQEGIIEGNVDSNYIFEVMKLGKDIKNNLPDIISQFIKSNEKFVFSSSIVPTINSLENDSYYVLGTLDSSKQVRTISPQVNGGSNCLEFPSTVYKLIPPCSAGETRDPSGVCQCPAGTTRHTNGVCYPPCPAGQIRHTNAVCYPPCPAGESRDENGVCQCNAGTTRHTNGVCYPPCPFDPSGFYPLLRNAEGVCEDTFSGRFDFSMLFM
jgi:hypothetical protein